MIVNTTSALRMLRIMMLAVILSGISANNASACYSFFSADRACAGDTVWFYPADPNAVYAWSFGDTASGNDNVSFDSIGYHIYDTPGVYYVTLFTNIGAEWDYYTRQIVIGTDCFSADFTSLCGSSLLMYFTDNSIGQPQTWSWNFGDPASGSANTSTLTNASHTYTAPGNYIVTLIITDGLLADTITRGITVSTNCMSANISFDITGVCVSDSCTPYVSYSGNITSYAWNFGDPASGADNLSNVSNPFHIYNNTGLYVVTLIISDGVIADTFQKFVTVVDCRVWPGDGNRDGEVNGDDLLPLGIYYGLAGTVRAGAASTWTPQPAADWAGWQSFMYLQDLVNSKHADCDGNGVIDSLDMDVISQNFGMKHGSPNNRSAMLFVRPSDPLLGFEDTTYSSQHFLDIPLLLTGGDSVSGIYGISATILYDITALNTSTINVDFANSWLGNEGVDMIALWDNDEVAGMLSISMVRTDKTKKKGIGEVARISAEFLNYGTSFTVLEVAPWSKVISNGQYSYQNNQQVSVPVNLGGVQLLHTSGIEKTSDMRNSFGIYPNPATNTIALSGDLSTVTTFEITDIRGAKIMTVPITSINNGIIDISELSSGVYLLRISDYAGISTLKFVKF